MIDMCVRRLTRVFEAMDGEPVDIELKASKVPIQTLQFNLAASDSFQLGNERASNAFAKAVALEVSE
jgi:hypothetical protein